MFGEKEDKSFAQFLIEVCQLDTHKKGILSNMVTEMPIFWANDPKNIWRHITKADFEIDSAVYNYGKRKRFEKTIESNIRIFNRIIEKLYKSHVNIIFTLLPRYFCAEKEAEIIYKYWKSTFFEIINPIREKYSIKLLNYKRSTIAYNDYFYQDTSHLNTIGAYAMTSLLCEDLKRFDVLE